MADVFLSYVRSDVNTAKRIADAVAARGWSVWWDVSLTPGVRFRDKIAEELHAARCVVVLWSKASLKSDFVIDEAEDGKQRGVLVQALIEDVRPPHGFRQLQAATLIEWDGSDSPEFARLCAGISAFAFVSKAQTSDQSTAQRHRRRSSLDLSGEWRELEHGFKALEGKGVDAMFLAIAAREPNQNPWNLAGGTESDRETIRALSKSAGALLRLSTETWRVFSESQAAVARDLVHRWLLFVERVVGADRLVALPFFRLEDVAKASATACNECAVSESKGRRY